MPSNNTNSCGFPSISGNRSGPGVALRIVVFVLLRSQDAIPRIEFLGPDVMQSGFGVNFLFWSGEF